VVDTYTEVVRLFEPLYSVTVKEENYPKQRPLLAHYTSMAVLEKIIRDEEIWFSNPLFMNDLEEVRFGIYNGASRFFASRK